MIVSHKPTGGPAFPVSNPASDIWGMNLRDWFAGQIAAGLMACPDTQAQFSQFAKMSYAQADALIAERDKAA